MSGLKVRAIVAIVEADGWRLTTTKGSDRLRRGWPAVQLLGLGSRPPRVCGHGRHDRGVWAWDAL